MTRIRRIPVPAMSLLSGYTVPGTYADCYETRLSGSATHAQFVEAFYTTPLFRLERLLLGAFASRPSTDAQAKQLALGEVSEFAAWRVESRAGDEVLLCAGRTRSWLMVCASSDGLAGGTRLLFGSAVVGRRSAGHRRNGLGAAFRALLGFHKLYSLALLHSARSRLTRQLRAP